MPDVLFAYHDKVTLGPTAMKVLAKKTAWSPVICNWRRTVNQRDLDSMLPHQLATPATIIDFHAGRNFRD